MQNRIKLQELDNKLGALKQNPSFDGALDSVRTILGLLEFDYAHSENFLQDQKVHQYESWFQKHPVLASQRAAVNLNVAERHNTQVKLYWFSKSTRQRIVGAVHFTPNYEDAEYTRQQKLPIGIDFFLSPDATTITIALSNRGSVRVLQLDGRLTNTSKTILSSWLDMINVTDQSRLHEALWNSFQLHEVNKAFYKEVARFFTELSQHLVTNNIFDESEAKQFTNRLIGRLLFIWFLRKKRVINEGADYFSTGQDMDVFYKEKLSKLFFETLNTPMDERDDKITPYLNGGLFDKTVTDQNDRVTFPGAYFKRLFDFFDEYNFTTDESTPDFEQVAIDPEMLGRIFENLLAEQNTETGDQARRASGAFYTPRTIVDYMCRESLRQYLYSQLEDKILDYKVIIDKLIDTPEQAWATDESNQTKHLFEKRPADRDEVRRALEAIKVIDPACGSGAFPMGMMQLLVRIFLRTDRKLDEYEVKLGILQSSIYGVDINPMAADISRLRAWLSLVVDEMPERLRKEPLPNLDFKFITANSLVPLEDANTLDLFQDQDLHKELSNIRESYFRAVKNKVKEKLKKEYTALTSQITINNSNRTKQIQTFNPFNSSQAANFFDIEYMFGIDDGFDIVIGNPPYVRQEKYTAIKPALKINYPDIFDGRADLLTYFIRSAFKFLKKDGVFCFITSNKFFVRGYGSKIRTYLTKEVNLTKIVNFGELPIFQASVDSAILLATNRSTLADTPIEYAQAKTADDITNITKFFSKKSSEILRINLGSSEWSLESPQSVTLLKKLQINEMTLGKFFDKKIYAGIKTGYDDAFVIDADTRRDLTRQCPDAAQIIKPWLRGKDVRKWKANYKNLYIIYTTQDPELLHKCQPILKHLEQYRDKLEARATNQKWFEMQQPQKRFTNLFESPKMIYPDCAKEMRAMYDDTGAYGTMAMYFTPFDPIILGILNSKLFDWYSRMSFASFGDPWSGGRMIFKTIYMSKFPLPPLNTQLAIQIKNETEQILSDNTKQTSDYSIINRLVYKLYNLTDDEIAVIENSIQ